MNVLRKRPAAMRTRVARGSVRASRGQAMVEYLVISCAAIAFILFGVYLLGPEPQQGDSLADLWLRSLADVMQRFRYGIARNL